MHTILFVVFSPLLGALVAGFLGRTIGRYATHRFTILAMLVSFASALYLGKLFLIEGHSVVDTNLYTWAVFNNGFTLHIGWLLDPLTVVMLLVVTCVSLLVHIYSIGYMAEDDGYQRFFSYISLFTFAMLMLVSANNFLQLFFGWEGVGLVSYLLIGFWYQREPALQGSLKAFLVNRVGDFAFILGIALVLSYAGSLHYHDVFQRIPQLLNQSIVFIPGVDSAVVTVIAILLFVGAMGKSAQMPLHVWLPESMEGPTPISALIHAATMVTAGVFMVARMSPVYEYSEHALSFILIIGATGALFTGLLALVMHDIKRVIAYSTLSQLGYMMVAMGVSAYPIGIFHLVTHAFFKAVLFLAAGSVIIALHHEQDMRQMGGLYKKMPITYATFLIGSLALVAFPPFAGFYSKDMIIEATYVSTLFGAHYAYYCVLLGAFVTTLYTFRALFMTFHGETRLDAASYEKVREPSWVVWLPLILLAIPAVLLGLLLIEPLLFSTLFKSSITVLPQHNVLAELQQHYHGAFAMIAHAFLTPTLYLVLAGIGLSWLLYYWRPELPERIAKTSGVIYRVLLNKYGFDDFNEKVFVSGTRRIASGLFQYGDQQFIDGLIVNGAGATVRWAALRARLLQSGYLYHYIAGMSLGLVLLLIWMLF